MVMETQILIEATGPIFISLVYWSNKECIDQQHMEQLGDTKTQ